MRAFGYLAFGLLLFSQIAVAYHSVDYRPGEMAISFNVKGYESLSPTCIRNVLAPEPLCDWKNVDRKICNSRGECREVTSREWVCSESTTAEYACERQDARATVCTSDKCITQVDVDVAYLNPEFNLPVAMSYSYDRGLSVSVINPEAGVIVGIEDKILISEKRSGIRYQKAEVKLTFLHRENVVKTLLKKITHVKLTEKGLFFRTEAKLRKADVLGVNFIGKTLSKLVPAFKIEGTVSELKAKIRTENGTTFVEIPLTQKLEHKLYVINVTQTSEISRTEYRHDPKNRNWKTSWKGSTSDLAGTAKTEVKVTEEQ